MGLKAAVCGHNQVRASRLPCPLPDFPWPFFQSAPGKSFCPLPRDVHSLADGCEARTFLSTVGSSALCPAGLLTGCDDSWTEQTLPLSDGVSQVYTSSTLVPLALIHSQQQTNQHAILAKLSCESKANKRQAHHAELGEDFKSLPRQLKPAPFPLAALPWYLLPGDSTPPPPTPPSPSLELTVRRARENQAGDKAVSQQQTNQHAILAKLSCESKANKSQAHHAELGEDFKSLPRQLKPAPFPLAALPWYLLPGESPLPPPSLTFPGADWKKGQGKSGRGQQW
ncbi:hypothetical protein ACOMHN_052980 [Nucella lapillus]